MFTGIENISKSVLQKKFSRYLFNSSEHVGMHEIYENTFIFLLKEREIIIVNTNGEFVGYFLLQIHFPGVLCRNTG